jgi:hypothetical protein
LTGTPTADCPLAPPPIALKLNAFKPLSRVRIWDGSSTWCVPTAWREKSRLSIPRLPKGLTCKYLTDLKLIEAPEQ